MVSSGERRTVLRQAQHERGLGCESRDSAHIWVQCLGDIKATVDLLIIFEDRHQRPSDIETRSVPRVDELGALGAFAEEAGVHEPRLDRKSTRMNSSH